MVTKQRYKTYSKHHSNKEQKQYMEMTHVFGNSTLQQKETKYMFIKLESTVNTIERKFIYMRDADFLISSASAGFIIMHSTICRNVEIYIMHME